MTCQLLKVFLCLTLINLIHGKSLRSPLEQDVHTVYPAGCSAFSLHQAIALDWSWRKVEQPGRLTRIVTGCKSDADRAQARQSVLVDDPRFDVFLTEDWNTYVPKLFPEVRNDKYMAYNRPFALAAWFRDAAPQETNVLYLDPDMIFVQPLLYHLPGASPSVTAGHPVAQRYAYVTATTESSDPGWSDFAVPELCGEGCPALAESQKQFAGNYAVGSPIMMHRSDWLKLMPAWTNYTVFVRANGHVAKSTWIKKGEPPYIAEMIAYALAAVVSSLPHQVVDPTIDGLGREGGRDGGCEGVRLIHLCYALRSRKTGYRWNKYRTPFGYGSFGFEQMNYFKDCEMPLFAEPPSRNASLGQTADSYWMIQQVTRAYNEAFLEIKHRNCPPNKLETRKLLRVDEEGWFVPAGSWEGQQPPQVPAAHMIPTAEMLARDAREAH